MLEIDAQLFFFSRLYKKDHSLLNKKLTVYRIDHSGISSKFKKFSLEWFKKRKQAHFFLSKFFKNRSYPYPVDFFLSKLFFWLIKKFNL